MIKRTPNLTAPILAVIPCLNEEGHIESVVAGLLAEADRLNLGIVVADGGSTDNSREIVNRLAQRDRRVVLMDNPMRIQAAGINAAVRRYGDEAQFLLRVDAHANYPDRYCEHLLKVQARTQADSVVVSMRTKGRTCFQRAAAAAQNSMLGNGGSAHRNDTGSCWVDHGHHALMTIGAFRAVGGYDETFSHNEDAELDARLTLFRQYFNIGRGRARNLLRHRRNTKPRHLVLAVVAPAVCLFLLAPLDGILALPALAWALLCLGYGALLGYWQRDACAAAAGVAAMAMQAGWSFGFFRTLLAELSQSRRAILSKFSQKSAPGRVAP
jgi:succinoglycan biosynthesis protein ExoA